MTMFVCPVADCDSELSKLQVMHFRSAHDCDPVEWVQAEHGDAIKEAYASGVGSYAIAERYEWLSSDMVAEIVETRSQAASLTGDANPMRRDEVVDQFVGESNPAKDPAVREEISDALTGHTHDESTKEKISRKNSGNEISAEHRRAVSEAASSMDRSYMRTEAYSEALSEALQGREPTYPSPYPVEELSHPVRSSWEEEIGLFLHENGIEYKYEPKFDMADGSYYPDFVIGETAIEVKGWATERSVANAEQFVQEYPTFTYVAVGDELPCDVHLPWEDRSRLLEVINHA